MRKRKTTGFPLTIGSIALILGLLGWFLSVIFEGEKPRIVLQHSPEFISGSQEIALSVSDMKRGLKNLEVFLNQEGRRIDILNKRFPFEGLLNSKGIHRFDTEISIDPPRLNLAQGRVDLVIRVWDCSRRNGGDGNLSLHYHKMFVDTIPPAIRPLSRRHNMNEGGTCLVAYQTSSDTIKSGLFLNDYLFPGYPADQEYQKGFRVCYFAIPSNTKAHPDMYLWAEDKAGNSSKASLYCHVRKKRSRTERINITDRYLKGIFADFSSYPFAPDTSDINKFLEINGDLRNRDISILHALRTETSPDQLWNGPWVELKNAAIMTRFLDQRQYYYKGKKVDEQTRLGVDLASLENSEVQAANRGRVIFADHLEIYGLTVVLDHGQGLFSVYSHLSTVSVNENQEVMKGSVVGLTGQTGLATGDLLHFGFMVSGVFVDPLEWWDPNWIRDNITTKLALLEK